MKKSTFIIISVLVLCPRIAAAWGKEDFISSANEKKVLRIGLADCIIYTVKNNLEIKIERLLPEILDKDLQIAKSVFHPLFELKYNLLDNTIPTSSPFITGADTLKMRSIDLNADITGRLYTGTEYTLEFINNRLKSNSKYQFINPVYETEGRVVITQPLFKGAGAIVNKAQIQIAVNNKDISIFNLTGRLMQGITDVKEAYYEYLFSIENCRIAGLSLKRARYLLAIIKERYEKGLSSSVEVLEASAAEANREEIYISAEGLRDTAEDKLKLLTNLVDDPGLWNAEIVLLDKPEYKRVNLVLSTNLVNAFNNRPDYKSAELGLINIDIRVKTARNNLLPKLDLMGTIGANGLGGSYSKDWDKLTSGEYPEWAVGLKVSYPWLNAGAKAEHKKAELEKIKALLSLKRLEQKIILDVRNKVRNVETNYRRLFAARKYKQVQQKNYSAQKKRFTRGEINTDNLLDYEEDLLLAQTGYIRAVCDYNIAIAKLEEAEGVTLERNNITLEKAQIGAD